MVKRGIRRIRRPIRRRNRKSMFNGVEARIGATPKTSQEMPWNTIVLQRTVTIANGSTFTGTLGYIRDSLKAQIQLNGTMDYSFRVLAIDAFDMAGRPFEFRIHDTDDDVVGKASGICATSLSYPARNGWSRARLIWPKAVAARPLYLLAAEIGPIMFSGGVGTPVGITNVTGTSMLLRIKILWRIAQTGGMFASTSISPRIMTHEDQTSSGELKVCTITGQNEST